MTEQAATNLILLAYAMLFTITIAWDNAPSMVRMARRFCLRCKL